MYKNTLGQYFLQFRKSSIEGLILKFGDGSGKKLDLSSKNLKFLVILKSAGKTKT